MARRRGSVGKKKNSKKYEVVDAFTKKAHKMGFVARSVFKLQEIDEKVKLYKGVKKVLDLGCSPGSWLQYAHGKVGPKGELVGIDIAEMRVSFPNLKFHIADLFEVRDVFHLIKEDAPFDLIQSDAMTKTIGIADADCARSVGLVEKSVYLAELGALKQGGTFLAKIFEGPGFTEFYADFKRKFSKTKVFRPKAIRSRSREVYVWGTGFKAPKIED